MDRSRSPRSASNSLTYSGSVSTWPAGDLEWRLWNKQFRTLTVRSWPGSVRYSSPFRTFKTKT